MIGSHALLELLSQEGVTVLFGNRPADQRGTVDSEAPAVVEHVTE